MAVNRKKRPLPFTYRTDLTVDNSKYQSRVRHEIEQLRLSGGDAESVTRLQSVLGGSLPQSDGFAIEQWPLPDGQILHVNHWKSPDPLHVVIYVNGLESHSGWFSETAGQLTHSRTAVYGLDRRGSGLNTRMAGTYRDWIEDLRIVCTRVRTNWPAATLHAASLCFGAVVATALAIQHGRAVDSLIYMSPGLNVKVQPSAREKLKIGLNMMPGLACNVPSPIRSDEMFTNSVKGLWFLYHDKLRTVAPRADDFIQAHRITSFVRRRLQRVDIPSVAFLAGQDRIVDNGAVRKALAKFSRRPRIIEYPDSQHVIFFGAAKNHLIADILHFIEHPA